MAESRQLEAKLLALPEPARSGFDPATLARTLGRLDARIEHRGDSGYPAALDDLRDAPATVFVRGTIPERDAAIAIVGARAATPYGRAQARRLAADLVGLGFTVVSGLARGIDAAAHEGALDAGGETVAVLPGGLDAVAPRHHRALAERIAAHGGLITEWASGGPVARGIFVQRNRMIAALAAATVVVEAAERSGSLSTAKRAQQLGRAVLAVPGDVDRPTSRGCHALIRSGAILCESAAAVVDAVGAPVTDQGGSDEACVLAAVTRRPRAAERIAREAGLSVQRTLAVLLALEWGGAVRAVPGQRWVRKTGQA